MRKIIAASVFASTSLLAFAAPALGQNAAATNEALDEAAADSNVIIVEARRRDESVQDVPLVVNTVTAETIEKLNLRDFKDIQTVVPGLTMTSNSNGIGTTSSVRGVNFDVNASGNNGTIEYYLNDSPLTSGALFQAMYDIGQIEVLRGPQGTLRGRASPSGSITIAHRKPDLYKIGGYAQATVNDIGGANVNAAVGAPIIDGILAVRVAGLVERGRGTRVKSINNPKEPFTRSKSGRVFVRFEPTDFLSAEGVYQRIDTRARQFDQVACFNQFSTAAPACPITIDPEDRLGIKKAPQEVKQSFDIFTWKASAAALGQRLIYVGSHTNQRVDVFAAQDDANVLPVVTGQFTSNDSTIENHEIRLQNDERIAGLFDYVVGYFDSRLSAPSGIYAQTPLSSGSTFLFNNNSASLRLTATKEESYFGNLSLHLGGAELSGGARHIKVQQNSSLGSVAIPGGVVLPAVSPPINIIPRILTGTVTDLAFGRADRQFEKTIYSASAKYRFNENVLAYVNFGTSFRPGNNVVRSTVNARASALETSFLVLPSETSKAYEIGFKTDLFDNTLRLNVAAFQQKFKNYPFRSSSGVFYLNYGAAATPATPSPAGAQVTTFNFVSAVPVRVRGVEFEADWRPNDNISLTGNLAYALGRIRNGNVACLDLNGDGVPDNATAAPSAAALFAAVGANNVSTCPVNFRSMTASPWNANVQGEYTRPVSGTANGFLRTLITYNGSSRNDPANSFDNYGRAARVNLYAGIRDDDGAWEFTLYGKNVFEKESVLATSNGPAFTALRSVTPLPSATINSAYINLGNPSNPGLTAPREFGVTARFSF